MMARRSSDDVDSDSKVLQEDVDSFGGLDDGSEVRDMVDSDGWPEERDDADVHYFYEERTAKVARELAREELRFAREDEADDGELRRLLKALKKDESTAEAVAKCESFLEEEKQLEGVAADARAALALAATDFLDSYVAKDDHMTGGLGLIDDDRELYAEDDEEDEEEEDDVEKEDEAYGWLLGNSTEKIIEAEKQKKKGIFDASRLPFLFSGGHNSPTKKEKEETVAIGMDLGTTNSGGAVVLDGEAKLLPPGLRPSVVCFVDTDMEEVAEVSADDDTSEVALCDQKEKRVYAVVGDDAEKLRGSAHGGSVCSRVKRVLGRDATRAELRRVGPLKSTGGALVKTDVTFSIPAFRGRRVAACDISAEIARQVRRDADNFLFPQRATRCVVGVPARFDEAARESTKTAVILAGFDDVRLLTEPEAAVLAYGARRREVNLEVSQTVFVFDLGGGTFDASVVELRASDASLLALGGDAKLGGDDFDAALAEWLALKFFEAHGVAIRAPTARLRLLAEAERCKRDLSNRKSTTAKAKCLARANLDTGERARGGKALDLHETLDRATFERLCRPILKDLERAARAVLKDAGVKHKKNQDHLKNIDAVLLVGGATRMPVIGRMLKRITGLPLEKIVANTDLGLNPDEAVALGCAIQANTLDLQVGHTTDTIAKPFDLAAPSY